MDFTNLSYLLFLGVVTAVCRFSPARLRPALFFASSCFYWTSGRWMVLLLIAASGAAFAAALALERLRRERARRTVMGATVAASVGLLAFYKSAPFVRHNLGLELLMPLGLSYYTFKLIGYVVDVYWGKLKPPRIRSRLPPT